MSYSLARGATYRPQDVRPTAVLADLPRMSSVERDV